MGVDSIARTRYRALDQHTIRDHPCWLRLPQEHRTALEVVAHVLPFRTNEYVVDHLVDWDRVPDDPVFQLTFPQRGMLADDDFRAVARLLSAGAPAEKLRRATHTIRLRMNPQPAGQLTDNVPVVDGRRLPGLQHKYRQTVLFFPSQGQTCHAYCGYCFRWAQFVDLPELRFASADVDDLVAYVAAHPGVTDVLITGGDPLIMRSSVLARYLEPLMDRRPGGLQTVRLGTKALAYWPHRFVSDPDADELLRLFERVVAAGFHLAIMAHFTHPVELATEVAAEAIRRLRSTGAEIRMQAPIVRHVNDDADSWAELWSRGVALGMVPYYMFVERDTGPRRYFEVPLLRAHQLFHEAFGRVSGLARTVRGPVMSTTLGKVRIVGLADHRGERHLVLEFLQARDPSWVLRPFFARCDPRATWLDDLRPAGGREFFFEEDSARRAERRPATP